MQMDAIIEISKVRRAVVLGPLALLLVLAVGCTNKKVVNPLANVGSKQPDKVLFDRAEDALKHNRFDTARITLQTLINTYPDSEFIARAKLAVGDSWYAEGGTTALQQAEVEYNDFKTFFPNLAEAAEAQMKIADIHYQQMEKADRDFTHAVRAEDEYRQMILQYPDSKLLPEAKGKLMEVQEVLADREFRIGRFYNLRQSYPAAIARLKTLAERYPLYSGADEALWLLGQSYEGQIENIRVANLQEVAKGRLIVDFTNSAAEAYSKIVTRYPMMNRVGDAKSRLASFHMPMPSASQAMVAQNEKEMEERGTVGRIGGVLDNFKRHPDTARATKMGEPTLVDPTPVNAPELVRRANLVMLGQAGDGKVSAETIKTGGAVSLENGAVPRSDAPVQAPADANQGAGAPPSSASAPAPTSEQTGIDELKLTPTADPAAGAAPAAAAASTTTTSTSTGTAALPPPQQVNEVKQDGATGADAANAAAKAAAAAGQPASTDDPNASSSKKKKKKHFPF